MISLYLIGGGGHCVSCIDVIESTKRFKIEGVFDANKKIGESILGYPVLGSDADIEKFIKPDAQFLICVGQIKTAEVRFKIADQLKKLNANLATVVSARAYVSKHAQIGAGTIVMHDALVNANAVVGENCILNTKSVVEHDALVDSYYHISTGAIVNGNSVVQTKSFVGSLTPLKESIVVPAGTVVPAGSYYRGSK